MLRRTTGAAYRSSLRKAASTVEESGAVWTVRELPREGQQCSRAAMSTEHCLVSLMEGRKCFRGVWSGLESCRSCLGKAKSAPVRLLESLEPSGIKWVLPREGQKCSRAALSGVLRLLESLEWSGIERELPREGQKCSRAALSGVLRVWAASEGRVRPEASEP